MPGLSNSIERFIKKLIESAEDGIIEIQRNELADQFKCVPSQINYVLSTRFTPYKGYYIESRIGGGGYIKIIKVNFSEYEYIGEIILDTIGNSITLNKSNHIVEALLEEGIITDREGHIIKAALCDRALGEEDCDLRNRLRASILKNILLILAK